MHDLHVMIDSGANCGISKNAQLLANLREIDCSATISGIGGKLTTPGDFSLTFFFTNLLSSTGDE
jgi:hypothetical protein